jgi:hypothetical protein
MFAGFCGLLVLFTVPETYTPKILAQKAKRLRKETGDDRYWAPCESDLFRDGLSKMADM